MCLHLLHVDKCTQVCAVCASKEKSFAYETGTKAVETCIYLPPSYVFAYYAHKRDACYLLTYGCWKVLQSWSGVSQFSFFVRSQRLNTIWYKNWAPLEGQVQSALHPPTWTARYSREQRRRSETRRRLAGQPCFQKSQQGSEAWTYDFHSSEDFKIKATDNSRSIAPWGILTAYSSSEYSASIWPVLKDDAISRQFAIWTWRIKCSYAGNMEQLDEYSSWYSAELLILGNKRWIKSLYLLKIFSSWTGTCMSRCRNCY